MKTMVKVGQEFGQYVIQLTSELLVKTGQPKSLSEMERNIRSMRLKLGQFLLSAWLALPENAYSAETSPCPQGGGPASYQFKRSAILLLRLGQVEYSRAYYLCAACQQGHCPLDQTLGLRPGQISADAQLPFGPSGQLFEALSLVSVSDHTVAKASQAMGGEVRSQETEWIGQSQNAAWLQEQQRLAERPPRLYGALDAAKVHIRSEKEHPWPDLKVGAWFTTTVESPLNPDDDWEIHATDLRYYCDLCEASQFGQLLWATGCQRQAQLAQALIFLGDGAEWIWKLVQEHYPEAVQIVDGFHATEYIAPIATAALATEAQQQAWIKQVRPDLWDGDLDAVIAAFEHFPDHHRATEAASRAVTYFTNNRPRMDYPTYRAKGYQIGSGTIESGCKQIVGQRLKVAGAIWNLDNCIKTAKARAALLSNQWSTISARREHLSFPLAV